MKPVKISIINNITIALGILFFTSAQTVLSIPESTLDRLHVVTFTPESGNVTHSGDKKSFDTIATALKKGKRNSLHGINARIPGKNVILSCTLPENYTGTIYLNVPPLIWHTDKYGYPIRGAYEVYSLFKAGVIQDGIGISYCSPNHKRSRFNFGQEEDQETISMLINEISRKNPQAQIVLMGICAGATGILNTLASNTLSIQAQQQIKAIVLQSPALSSDIVWKNIGNNYLPHGLKWLLPVAARMYFTQCRPDKPSQILASYENIPKHIHVMIGKLAHDPVTTTESVKKIEDALIANGNTVTVFESIDTTIKHGCLAPNAEYKKLIQQFLSQLTLDHSRTSYSAWILIGLLFICNALMLVRLSIYRICRCLCRFCTLTKPVSRGY